MFLPYFLLFLVKNMVGQLFYLKTFQKILKKEWKTHFISHRDTKAVQCKIFRQKKPLDKDF